MRKWISISLLSLNLSLYAVSGTWDSTSGGNWTDQANWVGGIVPNAPSDSAAFNQAFISNTIVTLDEIITIGTLNVNLTTATDTLTIANNTLKFNTNSGNASFVSTIPAGKSLTVSSVFNLGKTINITVNNSGLLSINGPITGNNAIIKDGSGSLEIAGTSRNSTKNGLC
ncbi:MAG: hypothetical protein KDK56_09350 [Simkania sp.]|nr:hypothetical protein [Simkania sp.]MCP5490794.1 hypothetical protein [Chlamydiales bacterium]